MMLSDRSAHTTWVKLLNFQKDYQTDMTIVLAGESEETKIAERTS